MIIHTLQLKHLRKVMNPALSHTTKTDREERGKGQYDCINTGPVATALWSIQPSVLALTEVTITRSKTP